MIMCVGGQSVIFFIVSVVMGEGDDDNSLWSKLHVSDWTE